MNLNLLLGLMILGILFSTCTSDVIETGVDDTLDDACEFVQVDENMDGLLDEEEKILWQECIDNKFSDNDQIRNNLIGNWELVGYMAGWLPRISQPCSRIRITEEEVSMDYHSFSIDTTITFPFELDNSDPFKFVFDIPNEDLNWILPITAVSEDLMVGPEGWIDADLHIYRKVE